MGKVIIRTSETPEQNYTETVQGETPCSLEVTRGQNGKYGYSAKLYFEASDDDEAMAERLASALARLEELDLMFRESFLDETPTGTPAGATQRPALMEVPRGEE